MQLRHESLSQTLCFGALKLFMTTNFADTYNPLIMKLYAEHDEFLGAVDVNLFEDAPRMPTSQRVHRLFSQRPSLQARFFLRMERVVITELLCMEGAYIGDTWLGPPDRAAHQFQKEDDYAPNGQPGLANFATCMLEPLELP